MSENAYHMEALRKARVIERQQAAQRQAQAQQGSTQAYNPDPRRTDVQRMGDGSGAAGNSKSEIRHAIQKDLWNRDRTLRNHNMYMGPMDAFKDLLPPQSSNGCDY